MLIHVMLLLFVKPPPAWQSPLLGGGRRQAPKHKLLRGAALSASGPPCVGRQAVFKDKLLNWLSRAVFWSRLISIPRPMGGKVMAASVVSLSCPIVVTIS